VHGRALTAERDGQLSGVMESLIDARSRVEERRATVDRQSTELDAALAALDAQREQLDADRRALTHDRHAFAEELVRINTVNKIHDRSALLESVVSAAVGRICGKGRF